MKLFFSPGACSLSPHIVLREAGLPFELEKVDLRAKKTAGGDDYLAVNPKGYVPALKLDDGNVITEGPAIVQYLADLAPTKKLVPPAGTIERVRVQEWLNFITSELHKSFSVLFDPNATEEYKATTREKIGKRIGIIDKALEGKSFLMGETFSVPDAYLFTILSWAGHMKIDLAQWPNISAYFARVGARPSVLAAREAEKGTKAS